MEEVCRLRFLRFFRKTIAGIGGPTPAEHEAECKGETLSRSFFDQMSERKTHS